MHRHSRTAFAALAILTIVIFSGCGGSSQAGLQPTPVENISGAELQALMASQEPLVILDVRTATEYEAGHIPGSINIPLDQLSSRLGELDPNIPVACVCSGGYRSGQAAQILAAAGFSSVMNLERGLASWDGPLQPDCPVCQ